MPTSLPELEQQVAAEVKAATAARESMLAITRPRTAEKRLVPHDEINLTFILRELLQETFATSILRPRGQPAVREYPRMWRAFVLR
jgi:hypothetical protein